ncbi:U-box domain-containing protein 4-like protein [Cinnamomum micranthum f. kanehirae]|uniref:U-box domain-containing protein 4-like protein n=1 Tax=Cinnamomum micranthum f. kanehirae TaxID=337451 RepID=A0A3S3LUJ7_9MAGN|nr:U-box domain-containing protein 4-like protein [Cinnamomum micranthum f. kanehirae]
MVSLGESLSNPLPAIQSPPPSSKPHPRSMRTVRSTIFQSDHSSSFPKHSSTIPPSTETLSDSVIDFRLVELAADHYRNLKLPSVQSDLDISQAFSDFSACSSDISGELQRLACVPVSDDQIRCREIDQEFEVGNEGEMTEDLETTVEICVKSLKSPSIEIRRGAAAKLRMLAKNRPENRALIGASGAIPALIPLLRCGDPSAQEHAVTALLNLSLHEENKAAATDAGAIKPLIFVLKTGTAAAKQNAACALLSLSLVEENRLTIGACGAIAPLVALLVQGTSRGKKDALTTLYKLCTARQNKERAVSAGAVRPLVELVAEQACGTMEKAMVVLSSLAGVAEGRQAIVEENGIPVLVEAIEGGSGKGKEFAVLTLLQLCADSVRNRGLLVREGGIPPLVALSQTGTARAKLKAETLLRYLREPRQDATS